MSSRSLRLDAYFMLRPILPRSVRIVLRRLQAKRLLRDSQDSWPINRLAGNPPDGWAGWPDGKKFTFVLTHDVEETKGLERCQEIAKLEMRLGFRSCFNFVPEGDYQTPQDLRQFLTANGFEVGVQDLHHDGKLYRSRAKFQAHAQKINRYLAEWGAAGFRSGFMLHNLDWIQDLNVLYDSSTFDTDPFEPQPEGANTIFPFWVDRNDGSGFVELPYTLPQDSTLFLLLRESGIQTWKRKLDWVAEQGGMALLNVHPDYICFHGSKASLEYDARFYEEFLEYVSLHYKGQAWFALPRDVARYFSELKSNQSQSGADRCLHMRVK